MSIPLEPTVMSISVAALMSDCVFLFKPLRHGVRYKVKKSLCAISKESFRSLVNALHKQPSYRHGTTRGFPVLAGQKPAYPISVLAHREAYVNHSRWPVTGTGKTNLGFIDSHQLFWADRQTDRQTDVGTDWSKWHV
jgi:hypothetical protein